jgi:hypothetical protein
MVSVTDPYGRILGFLDRDDNNNTNTNDKKKNRQIEYIVFF